MKRFLLFLLVLLVSMAVSAQTLEDVTTYGAVGNAQQVWVNITANSSAVIFTNPLSAADINKTIEAFGVGATNIGVSSYTLLTNAESLSPLPVSQLPATTNNNDYLGWITNEAQLNPSQWVAYVWSPWGQTNGQGYPFPSETSNAVYCIYGTNNANPFYNALYTTPTNIICYIPHGTISPWGTTNAYLVIPYQNYTNYSGYSFLINDAGIVLTRGGVRFLGDGQGQSILMGEGAFEFRQTNPPSSSFYGRCTRAGIFFVQGPTTNNYPVTWTNLTFDGGMPVGLVGYNGIQPNNPIDGLGWDDDDHAIGYVTSGGEPVLGQTITENCGFQHFRGEEIIDASGSATIEYHLIEGCSFSDGNGTALNPEVEADIIGNNFSDLFQVEEHYLGRITNGPSSFVNNWCSNIYHAMIAFNGGTSTNEPVLVSNNMFIAAGPNINLSGQNNAVETTPAANLSIVNNQFICSNACSAIVLNVPGAQGSFQTSNIWVSGNAFYNPSVLLATYGSSYGPIADVVVSNNLLADASLYNGNFAIFEAFGAVTNILFMDNNFNPPVGVSSKMGWTSGAYGYQYITVETNTVYPYHIFNFSEVITNTLSYGGGPWYQTLYTTLGDAIVLSDSDSNQIPVGAQMVLDNTTNAGTGNGVYPIYPSNTQNYPPVWSTNGMLVAFTWSGSRWTNSASLPPAGQTNIPPPIGWPGGTGFALLTHHSKFNIQN